MIISPIYYNIPIATAVITIIIPSLSLDSKSVISLDFKLKSPIYSHSHKQNGKHGKQYIRYWLLFEEKAFFRRYLFFYYYQPIWNII